MSNQVARVDVKEAIRAPVFQEALKTQLPSNINADKFTNTALAALSSNPDLLKCDRQSLYDSIVKAAQMGILPNGLEGAIVAFQSKATFMPMVAGLIKKLSESKISIDAQVVCENDFFEQEFGDNPAITHKPPKLGQDRGNMVGVYAIARLPGGLVMREVMDVAQIDAVKSVSRSGDKGPWGKFYGEMARKTVIRRLYKRLPIIDPRIDAAIKDVDDDYDLTDTPKETAPAAVTPINKPRPKPLQAVVDAVKKPMVEPEPETVSEDPPPPIDEFEGEVF